MLFKEHTQKRDQMQSSNLSQLLGKYGGEKHMVVPEHIKVASKVGTMEDA